MHACIPTSIIMAGLLFTSSKIKREYDDGTPCTTHRCRLLCLEELPAVSGLGGQKFAARTYAGGSYD